MGLVYQYEKKIIIANDGKGIKRMYGVTGLGIVSRGLCCIRNYVCGASGEWCFS